MKRTLTTLALLPLGLWGLFVLPDLLASDPGFWNWRRAIVILSGILALWWMSAGIVLAARPRWLEQRLGGLDKLYRWHKYLGIGGGILVFAHWMSEWLPKNLARAGLIAPRPRGAGPKGPPDFWVELAKDVGEWAGYILLALVVVALVKRIPYRWFRLVHKAFGAVFLAGVFHGLMMLPGSFWAQPLGWLTALLAAAGIVSTLLSLSGHIGRPRRYPAQIEALTRHGDGILEVTCRPHDDWPGHRAGQFLLANFGTPAEGAHPFTIASAWQRKTGTLTLAIKALGDYTGTLPQSLRVGQTIAIEGPYGNFDFCPSGTVDRSKGPAPQIWIAGGIGITPFLARLGERIARNATATETDFFYCTPHATDYPADLESLCRQAGVRLHRRLTDAQGPLTSAEIQSRLKPGASVWFCGPAAWGKALSRTLAGNGLPGDAFHREAFEFR
ncbi:ferric reductase-like transmembrane domain-containing protein [Dechloromonas sp. H13]|uniref:ferredoxin reductase family protein n=1 Tax=Dechloromonas sp. H13 TaxID=2570193 RepID=UPI0012921D8F|nr:ferric reductase-like transmembrane domain-containing protein [Dechloromonas sp. H13]